MTEVIEIANYLTSNLRKKIESNLPFTILGKLKIISLPHYDKIDYGIHYRQSLGAIAMIDFDYYYQVEIKDSMKVEEIINDMYEIFENYLMIE